MNHEILKNEEEIEVTQDYLKIGKKKDFSLCPIGLAIYYRLKSRDIELPSVTVFHNKIFVASNGESQELKAGGRISDFIKKFDSSEEDFEFKPFTIRVRLSDYDTINIKKDV